MTNSDPRNRDRGAPVATARFVDRVKAAIAELEAPASPLSDGDLLAAAIARCGNAAQLAERIGVARSTIGRAAAGVRQYAPLSADLRRRLEGVVRG